MHEEYRDPRLAAVYDALAGDRADLAPYVALAAHLGARSVVDVGCGTGVLALRLAAAGISVVGVDPAEASLAVARAKPGAEGVTWILGDAGVVPPGAHDLVVLTGNTAQAITDDASWSAFLVAARDMLDSGGHLVLETRDPARREWEEWTADDTRSTAVPGVGLVTDWTSVTAVTWPFVSFRSTWRFESDGEVLTSDATLRFRTEEELRADLDAAGFAVDEVRDAPDRPGCELVVVARAR